MSCLQFKSSRKDLDMDWEKLATLNKGLTTTDIKGKDYVEVNKRVIAFRELEPNGCIQTDIIALENGVVTIKATAIDGEGNVLATGYAQEKETSSFINKTSFIENCETSAVGRALGFCGIGIDASIASAEEVANAIENQNKPTKNVVKQEGKPLKKEDLITFLISKCDEKRYRVSDLCEKTGVDKVEDMTEEQISKWIDWLEAK